MKNNKGFSLVELIVVIAIMAILASVAVIGVSVYVPKAQKAADEQLAADIEYALELAVQAGELTPGDYVVIKADGAVAVFGNNNNNPDDTGATIDAAMKAAFGDKWTDELCLAWDGWDSEIGVAGDKATTDIVKESNFNPDAMGSLLSQLQLVVDATEEHFADKAEKGRLLATEEVASILGANGIEVTVGESLSEDKATAVANAYVYLVAGKLSSLDISPSAYDNNSMDDTSEKFLEFWAASEGEGIPTDNSFMDGTSCSAAEYARVYALATYIDKEAGLSGENSYITKMNNYDDPDPRNAAKYIWGEIKGAADDSAVKRAYEAYYNGESGAAYKDAVSFLAYMQGIDNSTDSLMKNTNLNSTNYYNDGYVADYVNSYLDLSEVLTADGISDGSFAFIYTGTEVLCMPLDW